MKTLIMKMKKEMILTSVLGIVLGVILIVFPNVSLDIMCKLIGIACLCFGIGSFVLYFASSKEAGTTGIVFGLCLLLLGLWIVFNTATVIKLLIVIFGIVVLIRGFIEVAQALEMKQYQYDKWWITLIISAVTVIFGFIILMNPFSVCSNHDRDRCSFDL